MANLGTHVVSAKIDNRDKDIAKFPVWEEKLTFFTDTGGHVEVTVTGVQLNGILQKIIMVIPVTTATGATAILTIDDANDIEIFNSGAKAENATYVFSVNELLASIEDPNKAKNGIDFGLDLSKDPTGSGVTVTVYLRGI